MMELTELFDVPLSMLHGVDDVQILHSLHREKRWLDAAFDTFVAQRRITTYDGERHSVHNGAVFTAHAVASKPAAAADLPSAPLFSQPSKPEPAADAALPPLFSQSSTPAPVVQRPFPTRSGNFVMPAATTLACGQLFATQIRTLDPRTDVAKTFIATHLGHGKVGAEESKRHLRRHLRSTMPDDDGDGDDDEKAPTLRDMMNLKKALRNKSKSGLPLSLEEMATMATMTI
jgi:hypothetical protein